MVRTVALLIVVASAGCGTSSSTCGAAGQTCCANNLCSGTLVCAGAGTKTCQQCGGLGQPCCGTGVCGAGLTCQVTANGNSCVAASGDGGNGGDMAGQSTPDLATGDGPSPCSPSGACTMGPLCGDACCNHGEFCDTSGLQPTCSCGGGGACMMGASCVSNIPVSCGSVCCPPTCPP